MRTHARKMQAARQPGSQSHTPIRTARPQVERTFDSSPGRSFADVPVFSPRERQAPLPDRLKAGVESLSGLSMDDVRVHHNSSKPRPMGAHAYAWGADIHIAPGQEQHLPHEAWHVVQQKQGRASVNDHPDLEREADRMGARASTAPRSIATLASQSVPQKVMQRKTIPTPSGEFETTRFADSNGRGVDIILKFSPNDNADAKKIALIQSVKTTTPSGAAFAVDPTSARRMVAGGKPGAGYYIDTSPITNNPIYADAKNLGAAEELKDTPSSANTTADPTVLGTNTNYEMGYCYKEHPTDAAKKKHPAGIADQPESGGKVGQSKYFETTALAIEGTDKDKYYGSVKWGFKMEGTAAAPTVTKSDIEKASSGTPTENFTEPAKLWNAAKTQGTIEVTADPQATVLKSTGSGTETLAKGTKLKLLQIATWGSDPAIQVEVLSANGAGSGKIIYIKVSDVKDTGQGGSANKALPIPAAKTP